MTDMFCATRIGNLTSIRVSLTAPLAPTDGFTKRIRRTTAVGTPTMARMAPWEPSKYRCTYAYGQYAIVEQDIRQFMSITEKFVTDGYQRIGESIPAVEAKHPDAPSRTDIFFERAGELWPSDHEWMLCCAVLRDAVSAFEVYVQEAVKEVAEEQGVAYPPKWLKRTPNWGELSDYCREKLAQPDPITSDVQAIIELRNLLTHERGRLRTEEQRTKFRFPLNALPGDRISLSPDEVKKHSEALASAARGFDAALWGDKPTPVMPDGLEDLLAD
ncbi:hypothetical protein [Polymorphospora rubra]|uniref:Uncharacterized protein n=1 Tax=Polymorphospora rubra TaxID=338584 RepID=A0A810MYV2_9ACTN|nr:hypothetical protein [Polymorphospora rubra]BCJ65644.1 hypothetical protein Prubr_26650 [Polymorphospora rubra]